MGHDMNKKKMQINHESTLLMLSLLFVVFHLKKPLYSSNQNTKFLHGAGEAGYGFLENDWTANTLDPLPLFTALVKALYQFNAIELTYVLFGIILLIYFYTLVKITRHFFPALNNTAPIFAYSVLFFLVYHPKTGLAGQYLLGTYLQPCVFGVFVLVSIDRFLKKRLKTASFLLALSAAFHPAYLPTALIIQGTYTIYSLVIDKKGVKKSIVPLILFSLISAPFVIRHFMLFTPTTALLHAESMDILTNQRIPHHTNIRLWFNTESFLKMCLMLFSTLLVRKSRLFPIMLILFLVIALSGLFLSIFPNTMLAFTTPWRHSVFLAPLSISILIGWAVQRFSLTGNKSKALPPTVIAISSIVLVILTAKNINKQFETFNGYKNSIEMGAIRHAAFLATEENLYLVPPDNSSFDKFRLETGIPILANRKTHPYKDTEVIEWENRCQLAKEFYTAKTSEERDLSLRALVERYGITHSIVPSETLSNHSLPGKAVYSDAHYTILKLNYSGK